MEGADSLRRVGDPRETGASFTGRAADRMATVERGTVTEQASRRSTAVSVMLIVPDAETAIAWYRDALGARELWNLGGVAGLEIDGAPFFVHEANPANSAETSPDRLPATSTRIELFVADPEGVLERALAAGATLGAEIEEHRHSWGSHRQGGFRDPFGHVWSVGDRSPLEHRGG